jgi:hypothetical protein
LDVITTDKWDTPAVCPVTASAWWALLKIPQPSPCLIHMLVMHHLYWRKQLHFCPVGEFHEISSQWRRVCYYLQFISFLQGGIIRQP